MLRESTLRTSLFVFEMRLSETAKAVHRYKLDARGKSREKNSMSSTASLPLPMGQWLSSDREYIWSNHAAYLRVSYT